MRVCTVDECGAKHEARGLCKRHYMAWWKSENRHDAHLRGRYGINAVQYAEMVESQGGLCAICGREAGQLRRQHYKLSVDHDHQTNEIRGLLCHSCNRGIGLFDDNPHLVEIALEYLR